MYVVQITGTSEKLRKSIIAAPTRSRTDTRSSTEVQEELALIKILQRNELFVPCTESIDIKVNSAF
jgi:hypothetical protein